MINIYATERPTYQNVMLRKLQQEPSFTTPEDNFSYICDPCKHTAFFSTMKGHAIPKIKVTPTCASIPDLSPQVK